MKIKNTLSLLVVIAASNLVLAGEPVTAKKDNQAFSEPEVKMRKTLKLRPSADESPKSVIKMNITQIGFTNLSFQYEYAFHKNMSAALGLSFFIPRKLPNAFDAGNNNANTALGILSPTFKAWAITPEFRFYPGAKEENVAPHGFYLAPYFRYAKYSVSASYGANVKNKVESFSYSLSYAGFTGGLMIGSQWIIGEHFSLDWWILGAGAGAAKVTGQASSSSANMSPQDQADLKKGIEDEYRGTNSLNLSNPVVTTTATSFKMVFNGVPMRSIRGFGICLGFAF
jgi:hypothetical protein